MIFKIFVALLGTVVFCSLEEEGSGYNNQGRITVEIVTRRTFDPENNAANLRVLMDTLDEFTKSEDINYPTTEIRQKIAEIGGKFAAIFEIAEDEATCEEVANFVRPATKFAKNEVDFSLLKCPGEKPVVLTN